MGQLVTSVSVILPLLLHSERDRILAEACIHMMRATTAVPFQLVIVEAREDTGTYGMNDSCNTAAALSAANGTTGLYIVRNREGSNYVKDFNAGIDASTGDLLVHTASDVVTSDGWLEAMLEVFEAAPDAGIATTSITQPGPNIGPDRPQPGICEAFYGALMMFPREFRLDEAFADEMSDADLCMQVYAAGLRSYRNNRVVCHHLKEMTINHGMTREEQHERFVRGVQVFHAKWRDAPWLMRNVLINGGVTYGQEHAPIYPGLETVS